MGVFPPSLPVRALTGGIWSRAWTCFSRAAACASTIVPPSLPCDLGCAAYGARRCTRRRPACLRSLRPNAGRPVGQSHETMVMGTGWGVVEIEPRWVGCCEAAAHRDGAEHPHRRAFRWVATTDTLGAADGRYRGRCSCRAWKLVARRRRPGASSLAPYSRPDVQRGVFDVVTSVVAYFALTAAMSVAVDVSRSVLASSARSPSGRVPGADIHRFLQRLALTAHFCRGDGQTTGWASPADSSSIRPFTAGVTSTRSITHLPVILTGVAEETSRR